MVRPALTAEIVRNNNKEEERTNKQTKTFDSLKINLWRHCARTVWRDIHALSMHPSIVQSNCYYRNHNLLQQLCKTNYCTTVRASVIEHKSTPKRLIRTQISTGMHFIKQRNKRCSLIG